MIYGSELNTCFKQEGRNDFHKKGMKCEICEQMATENKRLYFLM